jgi:hypothetical protein
MIDLAEKEYRIDIRKTPPRTIEKFRTIHKEGVGDTVDCSGLIDKYIIEVLREAILKEIRLKK